MTLRDSIDEMHRAVYGVVLMEGDTLAALRWLAKLHDATVDAATALVERGAVEGLTQKAMAQALNVPASTLRGLKASVSR